MIKNDPILGWYINNCDNNTQNKINKNKSKDKNIDLLNPTLQFSFPLDLDHNNYGSNFDICFKELKLIIEIDEKHTSKEVIHNDHIKSSIVRLNGYDLIRLDFQKIHRGEIHGNINDVILNNRYYKNFITELKSKITDAILSKSERVREYYIKKMFIASELSKLNDVKIKIEKCNLDITECQNLTRNANTPDDYAKHYGNLQSAKKSLKFYNNAYNKLLRFYKRLTSPNEKDFRTLFTLKDKCKQSDDKYAISFCDILNVLNVAPENAKMLLDMLYDLNIVDYGTKSQDVCICWKDLANVINNYTDARDMQKILYAYYMEIQDIYEIIIDRIIRHKDSISGDTYSYKTNARYISNKKERIIYKQKKMIQKLKLEKNDLENALRKLDYENTELHEIIANLTYVDNSNTVETKIEFNAPKFEFDASLPEPIKYLDLPTPEEFAMQFALNKHNSKTNVESSVNTNKIETIFNDSYKDYSDCNESVVYDEADELSDDSD